MATARPVSTPPFGQTCSQKSADLRSWINFGDPIQGDFIAFTTTDQEQEAFYRVVSLPPY